MAEVYVTLDAALRNERELRQRIQKVLAQLERAKRRSEKSLREAAELRMENSVLVEELKLKDTEIERLVADRAAWRR